MMRLALPTFVALSLFSCATPRVLILQAEVLSMQRPNTQPGVKLTEGKEFESEWCRGDDPVVPNKDGTSEFGMVDQVIHKAHKEHGSAFFLANAVYLQGECVVLAGTTAKGGGAAAGGGGGGGGGKGGKGGKGGGKAGAKGGGKAGKKGK